MAQDATVTARPGLQAEKYLRASGLKWTVVRPGGLTNETPAEAGNVIVGKEDSFLGLDDDPGRAISRTSVRSHPSCC